MQCALGAVGVFPIGCGMVMDLVGARNYAIYGVTAKGAYIFRARVHPPIHKIKVMAILVNKTAATLATVLYPVATLRQERPAKFLTPRHVWCADGFGVYQGFELCKKR